MTLAAEGHIVASRCLCEQKDKLCARGIAEGIIRPEGLVASCTVYGGNFFEIRSGHRPPTAN